MGDTRLRIRATADDLDRLDALVEREGAGSRSALIRRLVAECEAQPASSSASVDLACPACGARVTAHLRVQEVE